jgi:hypothetical protein
MYIQCLKSRASVYPTSLTSRTFPPPNSLKVIRLLRQKVLGTGLKNSMKLKESLYDTSSSEPYRIASINTGEMASLYTEGAPHSQKNEPIQTSDPRCLFFTLSLSLSGVVHSQETGN